MNEELNNVIEETVNVVAEPAKEGLSIGGAVIGGLAVTGAAAIVGFGIWATKKVIKKLTKKDTEVKPEPLADENFEEEELEEETEE